MNSIILKFEEFSVNEFAITDLNQWPDERVAEIYKELTGKTIEKVDYGTYHTEHAREWIARYLFGPKRDGKNAPADKKERKRVLSMVAESKSEKTRTPFEMAGKGGMVIYKGTKYTILHKYPTSMTLVPFDEGKKTTVDRGTQVPVNSNMFNLHGRVVKRSEIENA